ncbi:hypothetical protein D3C73_1669660 [compost metagenome]
MVKGICTPVAFATRADASTISLNFAVGPGIGSPACSNSVLFTNGRLYVSEAM